ncbi:MAG: protein kinase [Myxococcota bacterium]|nr:protein kinase [Myxococcota bacterium]
MKSSIPPPPLERSRIGRYEVIYPLGQGGMASVYVGRLVGMAGFERLVAIKVIHRHLSSNPFFVEMFLDEARLAASIHHPNVGEIFEVGEDEGLFFMVGELVQGESLRSLLRRSRTAGNEMPAYLAAHIAAEVCKALQAAHSLRNPEGEPLRLVHRDVSPRNVLLAYDGFVKLIDFGVAWAHGKTTQTEVGTIKGNVSYMSPEQICGQDIDRRSDLFSVGIVLYEMLIGMSPFPGKDKIERMHKILRGAYPRPREIRPKLEAFLEKVIMKALEHHPDDRYSSAEALGHDLEEYIHRVGKGPLTHILANYMHELFVDDIIVFDRKIRDYRRRTPLPGQVAPFMPSDISSRPSEPLSAPGHLQQRPSASSQRAAQLNASLSHPGISTDLSNPPPCGAAPVGGSPSLQGQPPRPSAPGGQEGPYSPDSAILSSTLSEWNGQELRPSEETSAPADFYVQDDASDISIKIPVMDDTDHGLDVCHSGYLEMLIQDELKRIAAKDESSGDAGADPLAVETQQDEEPVTATLPLLNVPKGFSISPPSPDSTSGQPMTPRTKSLPPGHSLPRWLAIFAAALLALTLVLPSSHPVDTETRAEEKPATSSEIDSDSGTQRESETTAMDVAEQGE